MSVEISVDLDRKRAALQSILREAGSAVVAFSGGVDSALLAWTAHRVLAERMLAVTAASPTHASFERDDATGFAARYGIPHLVVNSSELQIPQFRENRPDRCFHCKKEILDRLVDIADERGMRWVLDGTNVDDAADFRPGRRALADLADRVRSPLAEAGLGKAEIRSLSRAAGLPTWDKPAFACLASRIPYGQPISAERLARIDAAEAAVRELGFKLLRVRDHGELARVEIAPDELPAAADVEVFAALVSRLKKLGFAYVTLDLEGYRTGSMNEVLEENR